MPDILVTICARGNSKGIIRKNLKNLCGKPLIAHTIGQALSWGKALHVVVSTDSEEIAGIAKNFGAEVPFLRPLELASDTAAKIPAIRHALLQCEKIYQETYDIIVDLDVTAPLRTITDLDNCLELFLKYLPKTLFSVVPARKNPYFNMVEEIEAGRVKLSKDFPASIKRRQDAPRVYEMNASIYFYSREYLMDKNNNFPVTDDSRVYVMPDAAGIDIDRDIDFKTIEFLIREGIAAL